MSSMTPAQARKAQLQKLLAQRVLARRRLLQFTQMTHPAYSAGWVHDDICRRLERFSREVVEKKSPRLMLLMPPRHGKLLADDTMVLTSEGWKTHGDLVKGDKVMGLKGWTEVIGVSRPGLADCEVVTNAGTRIKCHRHHEWGVDEYASWEDPAAKGVPRKHRCFKRSYRYNVVETRDFLAHKAKHGHMRSGGSPTMRRFYLPSPDFTVYDLSVRRMLQYRRTPRSGGRLAIEDVTELKEPVPGKCIQVAAEDGVYLVTRDFVPTHNSELASIRFPAWHLGHNPAHEIINVGYNLELPMRFSRKVREVMRDPHYKAIFPEAQLDPDSQSAEAWMTTRGGGFTAAGVGGGITGKGCFRTSTHVHTRNGILPISDVRVGDEVLGYDHAEQRPQWTRVLAVHAGRLAGPARKHGSIWCTPDHEIFVPGRGYVPAGEALAQGLPILRWEESSARCVVSSLSDGAGAGDEGSAGLRAVQQPVPSSGGRAHQAHGSWGWEPHVLFGRVFPGLAQGAGRTATRLVRELQRAVGEAVPAALLFAGVLPRSAAAADGVVQRGVSVVEEAGAGARRASVRDDGQDADARGAPYRPRPYEQRADEPYFSLEAGARVLSFTPGWSAGRVAELVRGEGEVTVDLQTTAGNLFVEGVLAHNCHILVIDDPIKNQEEADSILVRDKLWDWYQSTAYTRLAPGGGVLVIETWWNDDDLAGRLQQAMTTDPDADQFEIVRYPALSEAWEYRDESTGDIVRFDDEVDTGSTLTLLRPKDTCLHEDRYPTEALKRIRANLQPRIWSALYQQNPVPDEGMYFKKEYFRYQKALPSPNGRRIYTAWDFAIGEKQQNDWTVGATVLQDETDTIYVLDIFRMKGDSFQIVEAMLDVALRWGSIPTVDYLVGAEDGQIWRAIEPLLKKRMGERRQYPPYEVMRPMTDKLARARPLQGRMQQGRVVFPEGAQWLGQAEQELLRFPAGAHDDVVDALAWAAQLCMGKEPPRVAATPPLPSWRDKLSITSGQGSHMTA
jgi:predicted phage terminase large subunit-like protein